MDKGKIIRQLIERSEDKKAIEDLFKVCRKEGNEQEFVEALTEARQQKPEADILNYWYYRLKIEEGKQQEQKSETEPGRISLPLRFNLQNPILTVVTGVLTASVLWLWFKNTESWNDGFPVLSQFFYLMFLGLFLYMLLMLRPHGKKLVCALLPFVLFSFLDSYLGISGGKSEHQSSFCMITLIASGFAALACTAFWGHGSKLK